MAKVKAAQKPMSTRWDKELNANLTQTSFDILLSWLGEDSNYRKYKGEDGFYKGEDGSGVTKSVLHGQIVTLLKREGIYSKTPLDVANKINNLEKGFKEASDWIANTGQGVLENSKDDFETYVKKKWPLFRTLEPIFGDHATIRPLTVVDTLDQMKRKSTDDLCDDEDCNYIDNEEHNNVVEIKSDIVSMESSKAAIERLKPLPKKRTTSSSSAFSSPFIEIDNKRLLFDQAQHEYVKEQDEKRWNIEERKIVLEEQKAELELIYSGPKQNQLCCEKDFF